MRAQHANQRLFRTITFAAQYADDRLTAAKRAARWSSIHNFDFAVIRKIFMGRGDETYLPASSHLVCNVGFFG
jgi:hypothetical protein